MNGAGHKLSVKEKLAYSLGGVAPSLILTPLTMFLLMFYTDVAGLAPAAVGTMFLITRVWQTAIDPLMGVLADRTETRWGKFRPYLLWMAPACGILGVLTFIAPHFTPAGKLLYAYVTYTLAILAISAMRVPHSALMGVISPDSQERTSICSYQTAVAYGGALIAQFGMLKLASFFGKGHFSLGFPMAMMMLAGLAVLLLLGCFAGTKERIGPPKGQRTPVGRDLKDLFKNTPWLILMGTGFFALIAITLRGASMVYYFQYCAGNSGLLQSFMVAGSVCSLAAAFLVQYVTKILGRKNTYLYLLIASAVASSLFFWVGANQVKLIFLCYIVINLLQGPVMVIMWAMTADTVDYSEWKTGRRATGLVFTAASLSEGLGWKVGGALAGWTLTLIGFKAHALQSVATQTGIRMMMSFFPAAAALLGAAIAFFYPLDEKTIKQVATDLNARRAAEGQPAY